MHSILYVIVMLVVAVTLLTLPLYPFWKFWRRLKSHHQDIWMAKGPFDISTMTSYGAVFSGFLDLVKTAGFDAELKQKDPDLVGWANGAREVISMLPKSFLGQIGYVFCYIWFVIFFTKAIFTLLG